MSKLFGPVDHTILISFLIATLVIGVQAGRKVTGFRTYAVGD